MNPADAGTHEHTSKGIMEQHLSRSSGFIDAEIASQSDTWRQATTTAHEFAHVLPRPGESVAAVGCGTSWFMAMAYASLRERAGQGLTDAFAVSEFPAARRGDYDRILAITRSGTTTEVLQLCASVTTPVVVITAVPESPAARATDAVVLPYADERSVVQTRFATTALALLRASLGEDLRTVAQDAQRALDVDVDDLLALEQVTFVGQGWTVGLAHEAALKCREAAQYWTEAYPAMEYRHGPKAIAEPGRAVWSLGEVPAQLAEEVTSTGARHITHAGLDPMAQLIVAQRFAAELARSRGLDPDAPRNLDRSVVLDAS